MSGFSRRQAHGLSCLRFVFLHDEGADLGAQRREARVFLHPLGSRVAERHVDDRAHAGRPRRHDDDARREIDGFVDRVGDQQHRLALGFEHVQQQVLHRRARLCVERAERLVHQQELGLHGVGAGEREALPHAAREVLRMVVGEIAQAHQRHVAAADLGALGCRNAVRRELQAELDVAAHGEPREHAVLLEDHAAIRARPGDRPAVEQHGAAARRDEAGDQVHQRRLAAARGADDGDEFAGSDVEADVVDHAHRPGRGGKVDLHMVEADARRRRGHRGAHAMRSCQATSRRLAARSSRSIVSAIRPIEMMPT